MQPSQGPRLSASGSRRRCARAEGPKPSLRRNGGAIVNIGSVASKVAHPIQGIYSASKNAVKAYTEALRMELEQLGAPISGALVKPTTINTMFTEHARSYMPEELALPSQQDAPQIVALTILHCAEHRVDEVYVGGAAKALTLLNTSPRARAML